MTPQAIGLSKSRVMAGLQCHKLLWWMVHEPAAPELQADASTQASMDRGSRVGEIARSYVPGGVAIALPNNAYDERIAATRRLLEDGAPAVYEASFRGNGVYVAVDILEREDRGFRLIEVKSSTSVKEHHIPDVAVQEYVLRQNGLDLVGMEVMHLNRACAYPDLSNLFVRSDVTEAARAIEERVPRWVPSRSRCSKGQSLTCPPGRIARRPTSAPSWPAAGRRCHLTT